VAFSVYFTAAFGIGAAWAWVIGQTVQAFDYPVAFGLMACSYVGAALLVATVRETAPANPR
jgi:hypothetical protein